MNFEELLEEYIKIFELTIEAVGQRDGNKKFQEISKEIKRSRKFINALKDNEPDFDIVVAFMAGIVIGGLLEITDNREFVERTDDLFNRHLRRATNVFLKQHGLPTIESKRLSDTVNIRVYVREKER